ncbi:MAG: hypothetical protein IRZ33_03415 [Alicyclobacillaceae bacterium]|nr:hypothetical protein [Alicyclobacillaceae bacterium]
MINDVYQYNRSSTLMSAFSKLTHPHFRSFVIRDKTDVYGALKAFFSRSKSGVPS